MNDIKSAMSDYERHRKAQAKLSKGNKRAVFKALTVASITRVIVEFDGEGDSGQINSVTAFISKEPVELPATTVTIREMSWGNTEPSATEKTLAAAIEALCYDYLEEEHDGWENNDGAFGEFHLDVAERTVDLEFHARYTDTFSSHHTF